MNRIILIAFVLLSFLIRIPILSAELDSLEYNKLYLDSLKIKISSYELNHQYTELIPIYIQLIDYYNEINDNRKLHETRYSLAECYYNLGFYNYAVSLLEYCQVYFRQTGAGLQYVKAVHLLIFTNIAMGNKDMANYFITQCEIEKPDKNDPLAAIEHSLLDVILDVKKTNGSKKSTLLKIIQYAKRYKYDIIAQRAYSEVGILLQRENQNEKAITAFQQSLSFAESLNLLLAKNQLYFNIYECLSAKKEYQNAITALLNYTKTKDTIFITRSNETLNKLISKHDQKSHREEGIEFAKDKRLFELKTRRANFTLYGLLFGIGAILIGGYFIIYFYQHKIEANEIISEQKEQINGQKIKELENKFKLQNMNSMLSGQELERDRIAKDLHDSLGGLLSTIKIRFDHMYNSSQISSKEKGEYDEIHKLVDYACSEVRSIAHDLKPGTLEEAGLKESIGDLLNRYNKGSNIDITYQHYGFEENQDIDKEISIQVYRIIQELVHNSIKHGKPKDILVQLTLQESQLEIIVEDNGKGFDPKLVSKGMGLGNIHSRVSYLEGEIHIDSDEKSGTSSLIIIPVKHVKI